MFRRPSKTDRSTVEDQSHVSSRECRSCGRSIGTILQERGSLATCKRAVQSPAEAEVEQLHSMYAAKRELVGGSSDNKNRWWIWVASALIPFIFYLGWTFVIEDSKGNLVIQSDLDDVKIQLKKVDGTDTDSISVQQGNSLTRLRAGNYEIELGTPSDGVVLSPKVVELKRGETVIAKVQRANQNEVVNKVKEENHDWLPEGVISEELLQATYKDKSILEHLRQVHLERDHATWLASVTILEKAIPDEDKPKIAPFIQASAERKGFLNGLDCLKLTTWISYEEIDKRIATWLHNEDEHIIKFLGKCTTSVQNDPPTRQIEWIKFKRTWQEIEDWLRGDSSLQRRIRIDWARRTAGGDFLPITEVKLRTPLNSYLYENYPRTALTIGQYYQYGTSSFGLQMGKDLLPPDSKDTYARVEARLNLARDAVTKRSTQELLWLLNIADANAVVHEDEFFMLVANFIDQRLSNWAASSQSLMKEQVQIQLTTNPVNDSWGVWSRAALSRGFSMSPEPLVDAKVSESIELLVAYRRLPEALRPRGALEKVRTMLETKDREITDRLKEVFDGGWANLSWSENMHYNATLAP